MEEYFADAPMTPEEYEEDQALYESHLPFIERILTAIQRFEQTRKLTPERRDIFYKWLSFGGVEVGPNMFQSMATMDTSEMSKTDLAVAMSQVSLGTDKHNTNTPDAIYAIDFLGCMKAFLSRRASDIWGLETHEKIIEVTTTLERFMDYLLQHDVCPEYQQDVTTTRNFCRTAASELSACHEAKRRLPGDFNFACSTIFGGESARGYDGINSFAPETSGSATFVGFTREVATHIINFAIAGQAPERIYQQHMSLLAARNLVVAETREDAGFEITCLEPPTPDTLDIYSTQARDYRPVGTVYAKPWVNPELPPLDLPDPASPHQPSHPSNPHQSAQQEEEEEYHLLIEQATMLHLRVGMKVEGSLHRLASGLWFLDRFIDLYPSFDAYLPNELMIGYKKPRWLRGSVQFAEEEERERREKEEKEAAAAAARGGEEGEGGTEGLLGSVREAWVERAEVEGEGGEEAGRGVGGGYDGDHGDGDGAPY